MRDRLSKLLTERAKSDSRFCILSGDHGYALFDSIRKERPAQFFNAGVAEQNMVGLSAGLARMGFRPFVYGLAAFVPMRVLEQIKLDVCFSHLPVVFLGDGAGLVYSTLGASHQCAEDIACLRPLPGIQIFAPGTAAELEVCFREAFEYNGPSYIRLGKSDRPELGLPIGKNSQPYFTHETKGASTLFVSMSSFLSPSTKAAMTFQQSCLSIPRIKPFPDQFVELAKPYSKIIVAEEHSQYGGLYSSIAEHLFSKKVQKEVISIALEDKFSDRSGNYQFALSEHGLNDEQFMERINHLLPMLS